MTRQLRRAVLALTVLAAAGAAHQKAHAAFPITARTVCTIGCLGGVRDCSLGGGSETFCAAFGAGCMTSCSTF